MAVLSKHGRELYRHEELTSVVAHMSDGQIMRNIGMGWKLWKKCKPEVNPEEFASRQRAKHAEREAARPAWCALRDALKEAAPLKDRWKVLETIKLMPDDPDGCWSTLDDDYGGLRGRNSLEDMVELCILYKAAMIEGEAYMTQKQATA